MAKFKTRRLLGLGVRLVGRAFEDAAQELQEWAELITRQVEGGIPAGFNGIQPDTTTVNAPGDPGTEGTGWAAADHDHPLSLGLTAKGDIIVFGGAAYARLGAPSTDGQVLTSAPASALGIEYRSIPGAASVRTDSFYGDLLIRIATEAYAVRDILSRTYR